MSMGERSCIHFANNCPVNRIPGNFLPICDVNCKHYEWDGKTEKDTKENTANIKDFFLSEKRI